MGFALNIYELGKLSFSTSLEPFFTSQFSSSSFVDGKYLNLKVQEVKKCQGHVLQLLQKSTIPN